jgi:hypothetical protein
MLLNFSVVSILLSYALLVWRRTDAFAEYCNLFKIKNTFCLKEYHEIKQNGYDGNYADFLQEYYSDKFIVRLATCPICLSFWLGLFCVLISGNILSVVCGPLALFGYLLFNKLL